MRHAATDALFTYWNDLRGDRIAPRRFELEPGRMGDSLPDTFILQREDAGTYPFRLAGTRVCARFKREFRGHNFLDEWSPADYQMLGSLLNTVSVKGGCVLLLVHAETASGRPVTAEMMLLPLLHIQPFADRFLGSFVPLDSPAWLGFEPITGLTVLSHEIIWPAGERHREPQAFDRQAPFETCIRHASIVRSDRRQFRVFEGGLSVASDAKP
ncbi:MAG: PAS domain-containing protein [Deltaproteobacteria bacterium]